MNTRREFLKTTAAGGIAGIVASGNTPVYAKYINAQPESGDVVIHNHPSGKLTPSQNDLDISSVLAEIGISSYIVNNKVDDIYVIFEPFDKQETKFLDVVKYIGGKKVSNDNNNKQILKD